VTRARRSPPPPPTPSHWTLDYLWPWIVRFVGLGIAVYETIVENSDRPSLLVLSAGMIGLPEFVRLIPHGKNAPAKK
jgi:hypothetical protein